MGSCFFGEREKGEKRDKRRGGGEPTRRGIGKKRKGIGEKRKKKGGKEEGREREEKKGFCILMRLSSSALTKVLSWSD